MDNKQFDSIDCVIELNDKNHFPVLVVRLSIIINFNDFKALADLM